MPDGSLVLLDFGCARSMEDNKSMTVVLKPGFAPLEQYQTRAKAPGQTSTPCAPQCTFALPAPSRLPRRNGWALSVRNTRIPCCPLLPWRRLCRLPWASSFFGG